MTSGGKVNHGKMRNPDGEKVEEVSLCWCYGRASIHRDLADKNYELLKSNPLHPSLHFKKVGKYRAVRIGLQYRALAVEAGDDLLWFWIGSLSEYDKLIG